MRYGAYPLAPVAGKELRKGTTASASTFIWQNAALPLALTLMPDNSVPSHMSLVPFKLLPQCWSSEGLSLCKSVLGFFKWNSLGLQNPPSHSAIIPLDFCSQKLWELPFLTPKPCTAGLDVGLGPFGCQGDLCI